MIKLKYLLVFGLLFLGLFSMVYVYNIDEPEENLPIPKCDNPRIVLSAECEGTYIQELKKGISNGITN